MTKIAYTFIWKQMNVSPSCIVVHPQVRVCSDHPAFMEWRQSRNVYTDDTEAHIDKQLLVWYATLHNGRAQATYDSNGLEWWGSVHGSWYHGTRKQRITIRSAQRPVDLRIYSYNIQYDGDSGNHRAIINSLLGRLDQFDVVCLQEVPTPIWEYLHRRNTTHAWIQRDGEVLGVASHYKPVFQDVLFPHVAGGEVKYSVNHRPFLCAVLPDHNIVVGTAHVWSIFSELENRTSQGDIRLKMTFLEQCFAYMEKAPGAIQIFAGDTNLVAEKWTQSYEDACLKTLVVTDLGRAEQTPTWDGFSNANIKYHERHRPDRVLVRSRTTPVQGTFSVENKDMRSDHFPVTAVVRIGDHDPVWDMSAPVLSAAQTLHSCYDDGYAFPTWSMENIPDQESMFRATRVYYGDSTGMQQPDLDVIRRLVREREPVNIGMGRPYDADALEEAFGYRTGYYGVLAQSHRLPPSLAIYTQARVVIPGSEQVDDVHILHAIGLAFDSPSQPDHQLLQSKNLNCVAFYQHMFRMIFACADDRLGVDSTVVLSLVGGNNFARLFPGGTRQFWHQVWIPALESHLQAHPSHSSRLRGMGFPDAFLTMLSEHLRDRLKGKGRFPKIVLDYDRSKTLFINAWDPWSVVGNGNASDNSLDGFVGRSSNVGVLSSLLTNPFLTNATAYNFVR